MSGLFEAFAPSWCERRHQLLLHESAVVVTPNVMYLMYDGNNISNISRPHPSPSHTIPPHPTPHNFTPYHNTRAPPQGFPRTQGRAPLELSPPAGPP